MKKTIVILIVICILLCFPVFASAEEMKIPGIAAQSFSEEDRKEFENNIRLSLLKDDGYKAGIHCFDVSENGMIALAIRNGRIYVYDSNGNFQYGYYFQSQGAYGVGFVGENVAIYFVRGEALAIYDSAGNCVDIQRILRPDYKQNEQLFRRTSKQNAGKVYMLERDIELADTYARLVVTEEDNEQNVIYDITTQHSIGAVLSAIGIIGFFALGIVIVIKQQKAFDEWEGIWYCRELKMQISFTDPKNAFLMQNGEKIRCYCDRFQDKRYYGKIEVYCQEFDHPVYCHGKTLFKANIISFNETTMVVKASQEYTFVRTDKIG